MQFIILIYLLHAVSSNLIFTNRNEILRLQNDIYLICDFQIDNKKFIDIDLQWTMNNKIIGTHSKQHHYNNTKYNADVQNNKYILLINNPNETDYKSSFRCTYKKESNYTFTNINKNINILSKDNFKIELNDTSKNSIYINLRFFKLLFAPRCHIKQYHNLKYKHMYFDTGIIYNFLTYPYIDTGLNFNISKNTIPEPKIQIKCEIFFKTVTLLSYEFEKPYILNKSTFIVLISLAFFLILTLMITLYKYYVSKLIIINPI